MPLLLKKALILRFGKPRILMRTCSIGFFFLVHHGCCSQTPFSYISRAIVFYFIMSSVCTLFIDLSFPIHFLFPFNFLCCKVEGFSFFMMMLDLNEIKGIV
ncbi:uncharacterized protein DS421_17g597620 [Arachis hypogaea]|nr:uncharacterized protein DS421_17g597620 [Arachis hypogaea]